VRLDWSEGKRAANIRRHGIDFIGLESLFEGYTVTVEDDRFDYGERRFITLGLLETRVITVTHTEDEDRGIIRIISARKATKNEEEGYFANLPH
jgi:hypothetical protein